MMQMEEDTLYIIGDDGYFQPDGITLPNQWHYYNRGHCYRFFVGYYPNVISETFYAFNDHPTNNFTRHDNLYRIKDDEGRYIYRDGEEWKGSLEVVLPGRGYEMMFDSENNLHQGEPFCYPDDLIPPN